MLILLKKNALLSELKIITDFLNKNNIEYLTFKYNDRMSIEIVHLEDEDKLIKRDLMKNFPIASIFYEKKPSYLSWNLSNNLEFIAGPCAVENEESLDSIAKYLSNLGVKYLRGGAYKFRSNYDSFQGLGRRGFELLSKVSKKYNMLSVSEVFDTHHLKYARDIDILQVGARAMFNTELLKALGRVKKPVILKKFYGSTLDEYLKMVDYVVKSGNDKVILCERGIDSKYAQTRYSLDPYLVYKMKEYGLPVCVDISHPAGDRSIIGFFSRIAVASEANMIMVEVHNDPINSLSDSAQAISLQTFETIYSNSMKYKNLMDTIETYG